MTSAQPHTEEGGGACAGHRAVMGRVVGGGAWRRTAWSLWGDLGQVSSPPFLRLERAGRGVSED